MTPTTAQFLSRLRRSAMAAAMAIAVATALVHAGCSSSDEDTSGGNEGTAGTDETSGGVVNVQTPVRFYREYVTVEPARGSTRVSALYYFRNESDLDVRQGISYPFPVDRTHLYPHTVRVWELAGEELRPMGFVHRDRNVLWTMDIEAGAEKTIRVDYTQDIREPRAVYIVTTTREWKRPIELAEFEFRVPDEIGPYELSFEPDSTEVVGNTTVHHVSFVDFMPDEDLTVTWSD